MVESYDVVVAGGGPAGLSVAASTARSGHSVLVVEQNKEIGSPTRTTGGSFVVDMQAFSIPARLYHVVRRCRFVSPSQQAVFDYTDPAPFCVMDVRGVFQHLAERAIDAGVHLSMSTTAGKLTHGPDGLKSISIKSPAGGERHVRSRIVVDATGYRSALVRQVGVYEGARRHGVGSEYDLYAPHFDQNEAVLIVGSQIAPSGYAWFAPWGNKRVRAGVGIIHPDRAEHPDRYLDLLLSNAKLYGCNLTGAQPVEYHFGLIPSSGVAPQFTGDGILAVGDAAGQPSALLGEGIRWAIRAGELAGAVASRALLMNDVSGAVLGEYAKAWNSKYGRDLDLACRVNQRIAGYSDSQWDEKTLLLQRMTPHQFNQAIQSNFSPAWMMQFALANPRLITYGLRKVLLGSN